MMSQKFTDDTFQKEVLDSDKPVLVDFWAQWCGPCLVLGPVIDELVEEMGDKVSIGKLNVDENRETAMKYQVMSIPTVILFKGGEIVETFVGVQPKQVYEEALKKAGE